MRIAGIIITAVGALFLLTAVKLVLTDFDLSKPYDQGRCFGSFAFAVIVLAVGVSLFKRAGIRKQAVEVQQYSALVADEAERQVQMVIRIFHYIGWPFFILMGAMTVMTLSLGVLAVAAGETEQIGFVLLGSLAFALLTLFFYAFIRVARQMRARNPKASGPATALSALMLLGFPLFTIVGVICLVVIMSKYAAYCAAQQAPSSA